MAVPSGLSQPSFTNILQSNIDDLRDLVACRICIRFMYEPFTTPCGHTFCYSCLRQWFDRDPAGYTRKTCPDCRAQVLHQPAPAYLIRDITQTFINTAVLLPPGETTEGHKKLQREEAELVEKDKANQGREGGLFKGHFRPLPRHLAPIHDDPDGVDRCPMCAWELEDGMCNSCGYTVLDEARGTYEDHFSLSEDYSASDVDGAASFHSDARSFSPATLQEILADDPGLDYDSTESANNTHRDRMERIHRRSGLPLPLSAHRRRQLAALSMSSPYESSDEDLPSDDSGSQGSLQDFMVDDMAVDHHSEAESHGSDVSSRYNSDLHGSGSEAPEHGDPTVDPHSGESSETTAVNTSFRRSRGRRIVTSSPRSNVDHSDSDYASTSSLRGDRSGAGFSPLQHTSEDGVSGNIPIQVDSDSDAPPVRRRTRRRPIVAPSVSSEEDEDEVRGSRRTRKRPTAASFMSSDEDADDTRGVNLSRPSTATASNNVPAPILVESSPPRLISSRRAASEHLLGPMEITRHRRRSSTRQPHISSSDEDVAARRLDIPERSVHRRAHSRSPAGPSSTSLRQTGEQRRERKRHKRQNRLRRQQEQASHDRNVPLRPPQQLAYIGV
ncbi:MAG: hypothetical protein LQ345_000043 [Seirophora villosa]|nr:MAG: hypothetical protein LQ345_000043 [Seirophora villosa]